MKDNLYYTTEEVKELAVDIHIDNLDRTMLMEMIHKLAVDWLVMKSPLNSDD
jgi:hypothetical protein